jgi:hypothetical protein
MQVQNRFAEPNGRVLTFLHPILIPNVAYWAPLELLALMKKVQAIDQMVNTQVGL